jgi:hypothetical protein
VYADKPFDWREAHYETDAAQFSGVGLGAGGVGIVRESHHLERIVSAKALREVYDTIFAMPDFPFPMVLGEQRMWRIVFVPYSYLISHRLVAQIVF